MDIRVELPQHMHAEIRTDDMLKLLISAEYMKSGVEALTAEGIPLSLIASQNRPELRVLQEIGDDAGTHKHTCTYFSTKNKHCFYTPASILPTQPTGGLSGTC